MVSCNKNILNRLKRAEGQLRGVQKMIADEKDCLDVITQLSAVRASVDRVMGIIVAENLKNCLESPKVDKNEQEQLIEQAVNMIIKKWFFIFRHPVINLEVDLKFILKIKIKQLKNKKRLNQRLG